MPLTTEEVIQLYQDLVPKIFSKKAKAKANWAYKVLVGCCKDVPFIPYTQDVLVEEITKIYGDTKTYEIGDKDGCIAGAVVREFNEDPSNPDLLQIFDCTSKPSPKVRELLKATTCAPAYFQTPTTMGLKNYIDGGVTGIYISSHCMTLCIGNFACRQQLHGSRTSKGL